MANVVVTNWSRATLNGWSSKGVGMSHSSGIFTFPSTGYWQYIYQMQFSNVASQFCGGIVEATANNGGSWANDGILYTHLTANYNYASVTLDNTFVVGDTANDKLRFRTNAQANATLQAGQWITTIHFIKISD
jgi:hypothetical protein